MTERPPMAALIDQVVESGVNGQPDRRLADQVTAIMLENIRSVGGNAKPTFEHIESATDGAQIDMKDPNLPIGSKEGRTTIYTDPSKVWHVITEDFQADMARIKFPLQHTVTNIVDITKFGDSLTIRNSTDYEKDGTPISSTETLSLRSGLGVSSFSPGQQTSDVPKVTIQMTDRDGSSELFTMVRTAQCLNPDQTVKWSDLELQSVARTAAGGEPKTTDLEVVPSVSRSSLAACLTKEHSAELLLSDAAKIYDLRNEDIRTATINAFTADLRSRHMSAAQIQRILAKGELDHSSHPWVPGGTALTNTSEENLARDLSEVYQISNPGARAAGYRQGVADVYAISGPEHQEIKVRIIDRAFTDISRH